MKKHEHSDLMKLYHDGEQVDSGVFAEMRSNILIMSGNHYQKVSKGLDRNLLRAGVDKSKRLRLVKNHTAKAVSDRKDIISSMVPGVMINPKSDKELRHQKLAELYQAIWKHGRESNDWEEFQSRTVDNFEELGECASRIIFNPTKGGLKGFKQKTELVDDQELPLFIDRAGESTFQSHDEMGQPHELMQDEEQPVFKGKVCIERVPGFDILRDRAAKNLKESPWVMTRKMMDKKELESLIESSPMEDDEKKEKLNAIGEAGQTSFQVFNGSSGSFQKSEHEVLVVECYFRQSAKYPKGYYYIFTFGGTLFDGEIPFGEFGDIAFPIKWEANEVYETSARGYSPIKRVRPAQLEVNRCSSSISETQIVMGADKILLNNGSKFTQGVSQPGFRSYQYSGGEPIVVPGRSGDQYLGYLEHNISEIYSLLQIPENENAMAQNFDPKAELYKRQTQKARFTKAKEKLERYYKSVARTYLFLAQKYIDDEELQKICGRSETVNLQEIRDASDIDYVIELEAVSGDLETQMGKTIELETILQYAGKDLDDTTRKILLSQFPMLNKEQAFKHLTLELENITADLLALDRGENPQVNKYDDHDMYIKFLTNRIKQKDFKLLAPKIQHDYAMRIKAHEDVKAQQLDEISKAQSGFIPTDGAWVKCDLYVNDPNNPNKQSRATFPTSALEWLQDKMSSQGMAQQRMQELSNVGSQSDIAGMYNQAHMPPPQPQQQMMPQASHPMIQGAY
jgi:hypothetical protein